MKILQIIPSLESGGAERLVVDLSNELCKSHEITICSIRPLSDEYFYIKELNKKINLVSLNKPGGVKIQFIWKLFRLIKREKPQIVHSHLASSLHYLLLSILLFNKVKFIHTLHNLAEKEEVNNIIWNIRKWLVKTKRLSLVSISEQVNESYKRITNFESAIIYNGRPEISVTSKFTETESEIKGFKINSETIVFLHIGRIVEQKNQKLLIDAFVNANIDNSILLLVGKDYSTNQSNTRELKKISNDRVHFLGERSNISDYLILSDVFCLSSIYEGMPITIIEALSVGLPIISTAIGGIVDMIDDTTNGILVRDLSVESYTGALTDFCNLSKEDISIIRNNNIKHYKNHFCISETASKYESIYKQ